MDKPTKSHLHQRLTQQIVGAVRTRIVTCWALFAVLLATLVPSSPILAQQAGIEIASIEQATNLLGDAQPSIRAQAALYLSGQTKNPDIRSSIPLLIELLDDQASAIITDLETGEPLAATPGNYANKALLRLKEQALNPLHVALIKSRPSLRWRIAHLLGEIAHNDSVSFLLNALTQDADRLVRIASGDAIAAIGVRAVPELMTLLGSATDEQRKDIIWILSEIGDERVISSLLDIAMTDDSPNAARAVEALLKMGAPIIDPILKKIEDNDLPIDERNRAILICARLNHPRAVQALLYTLLTHDDDNVRLNALQSLTSGHVNNHLITDTVLNVLFDIDPRFRNYVPTLMQHMGGDAAAIILSYLNNPSPRLQQAALQSIKHVKPDISTQALVQVVNREGLEVKTRQAAAYYLSDRGYKGVEYTDKLNCFVILGNWRLLSALGKEYWRFYVKLTNHEEDYIREGGVNMLSSLNDTMHLPIFVKMLADESPRVKESATFALARLERDSNENLAQFLDIEVSDRVLIIGRTLDQKGYRPKTDIDRVNFYSANEFWTQMEALGESAISYLLEIMLDHPDVKKRTWAAWTLARFYNKIDLEGLSLRDLDRSLYYLLYPDQGRISNTTYVTLAAEADQHAVSYLLVPLLCKKQTLNEKAAKSLGRTGAAAVAALEHLLDSGFPEAREAALRALEDMGPSGFTSLVKYMRHEEIGKDVLEQLGRMNFTPRNASEKIEYFLATAEYEELARMGRIGISPLVEAAADKENPHRLEAVRAVGLSKDPSVTQSLVLFLMEEGNAVRAAASSAIRELGPVATSDLKKIAFGQHLSATRAAAIGLDIINYEAATREEEIWLAAARRDYARFQEFGEEGQQMFKDYLISNDNYVRALAAATLSANREYTIMRARREQSKFPTDYTTALSSESADIRGMGAYYVAVKGTNQVELIPKLISMLGDDAIIQWSDVNLIEVERMKTPGAQAAVALSRIGEPAIDSVLQASESGNSIVRFNANLALAYIPSQRLVDHQIKLLKDGPRTTRALAAYTLGRMRAAEATLPLLDNLTHENDRVQHISRVALLTLKELAVPILIDELQNIDESARQELIIDLLGMIESPTAIPALSKFMKQENISVRRSALRSLSKMPSDEAVTLLITGLDDPFWTIRETSTSPADLQGPFGSQRLNRKHSGSSQYPVRLHPAHSGANYG